jgi:hypothetical protein
MSPLFVRRLTITVDLNVAAIIFISSLTITDVCLRAHEASPIRPWPLHQQSRASFYLVSFG